MPSDGSGSSRKQKVIMGPAMFDLLIPLAMLKHKNKKGRGSKYHLICKSGGGPLDVDALRYPPVISDKSSETSRSTERSDEPSRKSHTSKKSSKSHSDKGKETATSQRGEGSIEKPTAKASAVEHNGPPPGPSVYTSAQDAKLLELKAANKTWKEIVEELGYSKSVWQARFKQIKSGAEGAGELHQNNSRGNTSEKEATKGEGSTDKKDKGKIGDNIKGDQKDGGKGGHMASSKASSKKEGSVMKGKAGEDQPRKRIPTPPASVDSGYASSSEPRLSMSALTALLESDAQLFSPAEIVDLYRMLKNDENERWTRVASMFFRKTGKRVHEDHVRDAINALVGKSRM
ncbi:hypothetical protein ANO11243_057890 [Dothideomycetidae sp. 11243]|nr:hypothetical protein ANO11243_057890 [fungal sp. No.11243]